MENHHTPAWLSAPATEGEIRVNICTDKTDGDKHDNHRLGIAPQKNAKTNPPPDENNDPQQCRTPPGERVDPRPDFPSATLRGQPCLTCHAFRGRHTPQAFIGASAAREEETAA